MPIGEPVEVIHRTTRDGDVEPQTIIWYDECEHPTEYPIDEIIDRRKAAATKVGGYGIRFHVRLRRAQRYLFYIFGKWYAGKIN